MSSSQGRGVVARRRTSRRRKAAARRGALPAAALAVLALAAGALQVTGRAFGEGAAPISFAPCTPATLPQGERAQAHTVLLIDRSRSARGAPVSSGGEPGSYAALLEPVVREAVREGHTVSIAAFDGGAELRWRWSVTRFRGNDDLEAGHQRNHQACLLEALEEAVASPPAVSGTDVLAAFRAAAVRLGEEDADRRRLIIATDGLTTSGCASMVGAGLSAEEVEAAVSRCETGELPVLDGVEVEMWGLGDRGAGSPALDSRQAAWVKALWQRLCDAASEGSCRLPSTPDIPASGLSPLSEEAPEDPDPGFPRMEVEAEGELLAITIPASLLFDTNSDELLGDAAAQLDAAVAELAQRQATNVRVEGHADSRGDPEANRDLSQRRADRVGDALVQRGATVTVSIGLGETDPLDPDDVLEDGSPDLAAMAADRRVEIRARASQPTP